MNKKSAAPGLVGRAEEDIEAGRPDYVPAERLVFLSDAVFAIAMTILALDLLPDSTDELHGSQLIGVLLSRWPSVLSFAITFWVIGIYWRAHASLFRYLAWTDSALTSLNLLVLMLVCFLPFPTAILSDHGPDRVAVIFYAASISLLGLAFILLCRHLLKEPSLLRAGAPRHLVDESIGRSWVTIGTFGISALIALADPWIAMAFWVIGPVAGDFVRRHFAGERDRHRA